MSTYKFISFAVFIVVFGKTIQAAAENFKEIDLQSIAKFIGHLPNIYKAEIHHSCWKQHTFANLHRLLGKQQTFVQFSGDWLPNTTRDANQVVHILDLTCPEGLELLLKANNTNYVLQPPFTWLITVDKIMNFPLNLAIFLNSRIYLYQKDNENLVYSVYRQEHSMKYYYNEIAEWRKSEYKYFRQISDYRNRSNIQGTVLRASVPLMHHKSIDELDFRDLSSDTYSKCVIGLIRHLTDLLNATLVPLYTDSWATGLVGDLQKGNAEIAISVLFITKDRINFISYTSRPIYRQVIFIFRAPPLSVVKNILTMPLQTKVWFCIFLLTIIMFFVLLIIIKWEWKHHDSLHIHTKTNVLPPRVIDIIQMEMGAIFQQGSEAEPKSLSGQTATFFIFLAFLFFYTAYSACIVALLQSTTDSIDTLQDLLTTDIKLKFERIPYMDFLIQQSLNTEVTKNIYRTKIKQPGQPYDYNYVNINEGVTCIRNDFCAFFADEDRIYKQIIKTFTEPEKCGLMKMKFSAEVYPYIPFRKNSIYTELFRVSFARMTELGLRNRNFLRTFVTPPKCTTSGGNFRSVSIMDCYFSLLSFSVGTSIAVMVFLFEILYYRYIGAKMRAKNLST